MKQTAKATGIEGRIVNLSSIAHTYTYEEGIRLDDINDQIGYALHVMSLFYPLNTHSHTSMQISTTALQFSFKFFSYSDKKAYGQSKLANILHAKELSRRLQVNLY